MANRTSILAGTALFFSIIGIALGGYAVLGDLSRPVSDFPKAKAYLASPFNLASGSDRKINFTSVSFDSHGAFNLANHTYAVPKAGYYSIDAQFCTVAYGGDFFGISVYKSGKYVLRGGFIKGGSSSSYHNAFAVSVSGIVECNASDQLYVVGYFFNATGPSIRALYPDPAYTFLSIAKLP